MLPIGDERVHGPAPLVTFGLIALNVLAFLVELTQPSEGALQSFIQAWGVVPREYSMARDLPPTIPLPFWSTLFTSMFLHGGWMHLGGNMLYLWIFGDNLEKVMGGVRFLIFYLACGLAASLAHILFGLWLNHSCRRCVWGHQRRTWRVSRPLPQEHRPSAHAWRYRKCAGDCRSRLLDRDSNDQRNRIHGGDNRNRWYRIHGTHRRVRRRTRTGQADGLAAATGVRLKVHCEVRLHANVLGSF